jgi:hypothetical protein
LILLGRFCIHLIPSDKNSFVFPASFGRVITIDKYKGKTNMMLHGQVNKIDSSRRKLYHSNVFYPSWLKEQAEFARDYISSSDLHLTFHARQRLEDKKLDCPTRYDVAKGEIIEIEVDSNNRIVKMIIRASKKSYDLCFGITCNRNITTIYGREKTDNNQTLEVTRYVNN